MATEQPNFILRGVRNFGEKTFKLAVFADILGLFIPPLLGPALGWTAFDWATTSFIAKSRLPYAGQ